jgi:hypothetical protein
MSDIASSAARAIPPLPDGWYVLRHKVLAGSRLAVVGANADLHAAWRSDHERKTAGETLRLAVQAACRIWTLDGDDLTEAVEFPLLEPFPNVDQFPDKRWLVANSRSNGIGNARVLRADGTEERRIELGDGIEHIKIDDQQRVWVGWFDEGIFGNGRWRYPGLKWPPSSYGIASFDERGELVKHATLQSIADCYALNVLGDIAWACTYTDFPVWEIGDERERTWSTELSGTNALAVSYPYVLAAGGYRDDANRACLLRLNDERAEMIGEWRLPIGADRAEFEMDGRGDELHVVANGRWHRWCIRDFVD